MIFVHTHEKLDSVEIAGRSIAERRPPYGPGKFQAGLRYMLARRLCAIIADAER